MQIKTRPQVIAFLISVGRLLKKDAKNPKKVRAAIFKFQRDFKSLKVDGDPGPLTRKAMNCPRCGVSDAPMMREALRWRKTSLLFTIVASVPSQSLSAADQRDIIHRSGNKWAGYCGIIEWREAKKSETADVIIGAGRGRRHGFDGPGSTLAWAELPDGRDTQKRMMYDLDEIWVGSVHEPGIPFETTTDHELGHIWGLDHSTNPGDLMYPTLNKAISGPQPGDIQRIVAEYGPPETPLPPAIPTPSVKEYTLRASDLQILGYDLVKKP